MRNVLEWLCWWRPPCLLAMVIVNRVDDRETALRGLLWRSRGAWLVLKQAEALTVGQAPTAIDGEVLIHRSQVSFIQRLT